MKRIHIMMAASLLLPVVSMARGAVADGHSLDNLNGRTEFLVTKCICQDEEGLIWFGTDRALYSYDGYDVQSRQGSISNIQTKCLASDGDTLVIGCNDGLLLYDKVRSSYRWLDYFRGDVIRALYFNDGYLYVGAGSGLYCFRWTHSDSMDSIVRISQDDIWSLCPGSGGLWFGSDSGYGFYSFSEETVRSFAFDDGAGRRLAHSLLLENDSTLFIGTTNSLVKVDLTSFNSSVVHPAHVVKSITKGDDGVLYLGTDSGLLACGPDGNTVSLSRGIISSTFKDREGNVWFATDNGLLVAKYHSTIRALDTGDIPENTVVNLLLKDSHGRLWAGGINGIQMYRTDASGQYIPVRYYPVQGSGKYNIQQKINGITEDMSTGAVILATDIGYQVFDERTQQFEKHRVEGVHNWFYDILPERDRMWIASYDGILSIDKAQTVSRLSVADGLSSNDIVSLGKDHSGAVWALTRDQNLYRINCADSVSVTRFPVEEYVPGGLADCMLADKEGTVWITVGDILLHFNPMVDGSAVGQIVLGAEEDITVYTMSDCRDKIWICTSDGIYYVDKKSGAKNSVNTGKRYVAISYDDTENLFLAGSTGHLDILKVEDIEKIQEDGGRYPVSVRSVTVNDRVQISSPELRDGDLTLKSDQNSLLIRFSNFSYGDDVPARFKYRFGDEDSEWRDVISGNTISLADVNPGLYCLQITSGNPNREDIPVLLRVRIRHPWYLSLGMIAVYLLLAAVIVFFIVKFITLRQYLALERKQREMLLHQSRQKEDFFSSISHELKTPLSLIVAPLSRLKQLTVDEESLRMLDIAQDNVSKLSALVHNTLDYYRNGDVISNETVRIEIDFVEFSRAIFNSYRENYPQHEFIFDSNDNYILTRVDAAKMEMVINNLLSNACKYTPAGGSVIMTVERDDRGGQLVFKVSDTGVGIPGDELQQVFMRFYESSRTKGGNYDSTGIGLPIIRQIVEEHDGHIGVDSDDNGTTFAVMIPCLVPVHRGTDGEGEADDGKMQSKPLIVIVDDNEQMCGFLKSVLAGKYRCISSNNGRSGLKLCKDVVPDLIVSDVMMPLMDGLEMCRQLREFSPLATVPIILLTAKGDRETEQKSIGLNIESFVPKPFDLTMLLAKIDQLIGNRQRVEQKLRMDMLTMPKDDPMLSYDEKYIRKVTGIIEEHLNDTEFSVSMLCSLGGFSEKQLYRKVKQMTGLSTVEYIRSIRLKKAALMFQNGSFTVSEVMYSVGFANASYFTRTFVAAYGKTPSDYSRQYRQ